MEKTAWTILDEKQLEIFNKLKYYLRDMLLHFEIVEIEKFGASGKLDYLQMAVDHLNEYGFCAKPESFEKISEEEALFQLEWKLTYTEFMNVILMPTSQILSVQKNILELLGPIKFGYSNAVFDLKRNEVGTRPIICIPPEIGDYQNMTIILVGLARVVLLSTYCEY